MSAARRVGEAAGARTLIAERSSMCCEMLGGGASRSGCCFSRQPSVALWVEAARTMVAESRWQDDDQSSRFDFPSCRHPQSPGPKVQTANVSFALISSTRSHSAIAECRSLAQLDPTSAPRGAMQTGTGTGTRRIPIGSGQRPAPARPAPSHFQSSLDVSPCSVFCGWAPAGKGPIRRAS